MRKPSQSFCMWKNVAAARPAETGVRKAQPMFQPTRCVAGAAKGALPAPLPRRSSGLVQLALAGPIAVRIGGAATIIAICSIRTRTVANFFHNPPYSYDDELEGRAAEAPHSEGGFVWAGVQEVARLHRHRVTR
jgi:hypothetical protein